MSTLFGALVIDLRFDIVNDTFTGVGIMTGVVPCIAVAVLADLNVYVFTVVVNGLECGMPKT